MLGYYSAIMHDKPIAYYRLGELSGSAVKDSSGNANNGTLSATGVTLNQTGAITGDPNASMLFDGSSGTATLPLFTAALQDISIEFWAYLPSSSARGPALMIGNGNGYGVGFGSSNWNTYGTQVIAAVQNIAWVPAPGSVSLSLNAWHHVVWVYQPSGNSTSAFYADGSLLGSLSTSAPQTPTTNAYLAVDPLVPGTRILHVRLDEVAIYNQVGGLTADQITRHYHAGIKGNIWNRNAMRVGI